MNIGIDFTWVIITTLAMIVIAALNGNKALNTIRDMESDRILKAGLCASLWLLLFSVFISTKNLPDYMYTSASTFISCVIGMFLCALIAKVILDVESGATSIFSKKTMKGGLVIVLTVLFSLFIDKLPDFYTFLSKHIRQQTLDDPSLSLVGDMLVGFVLFVSPFLLYKMFLKK